ncbi:hypothetical protein EMIHUDRAFT_232439 [Emiliania huxleyi CCMP1516]|uniref:ShKT domain-containing protein n=2 Tax=Emiliania huxleyi TaxID=2903 RepID=A0A0D3K4Z3_EMIH1|nr:hypothetical protein EMIHUDRAFT_232439 [Emiliania huxleyi CCMP1516]EOD30828.1 hypothetical protein EMIHUDRAFT_232439 [Emiliania huxleyi CCMP1516]|eukprot:XP_005783257.1 hypothetical protein EMIHUDRAFT_232439 [Emiliania huxleyi CCMP1516]
MHTATEALGPCADWLEPNFRASDGSQLSCFDLAFQYGLCDDPAYGCQIKRECPASCGACIDACTANTPGSTSYIVNGEAALCSALEGYCEHAQFGTEITAACPTTDGSQLDCFDLAVEYDMCDDPTYGCQIKRECPASCGACIDVCAADTPGSASYIVDGEAASCSSLERLPANTCASRFDFRTSDGSQLSCFDLAFQYGLCDDPAHGCQIKRECPASCGACIDACAADTPGSTSFAINGQAVSCSSLERFCDHAHFRAGPLAVFSPPLPPACADWLVPSFLAYDMTQLSCSDLAFAYDLCHDAAYGCQVKRECPASCGACIENNSGVPRDMRMRRVPTDQSAVFNGAAVANVALSTASAFDAPTSASSTIAFDATQHSTVGEVEQVAPAASRDGRRSEGASSQAAASSSRPCLATLLPDPKDKHAGVVPAAEWEPLSDGELEVVRAIRGWLGEEAAAACPRDLLVTFTRGYAYRPDWSQASFVFLERALAWREEMGACGICFGAPPARRELFEELCPSGLIGHLVVLERLGRVRGVAEVLALWGSGPSSADAA